MGKAAGQALLKLLESTIVSDPKMTSHVLQEETVQVNSTTVMIFVPGTFSCLCYNTKRKNEVSSIGNAT